MQPRERVELTAELIDADGGSSDPITALETDLTDDAAWQWSRSSSANGPWTDIEEKEPSEFYTPTADDVGSYLRATASYNDGHGEDKTANGVTDNDVVADTSNKTPVFPDQDPDMDGEPSDTATRKVAENSAPGSAVGDPIAATDANGDTLTYTLGGDDASSFTIDRGTGQIRVGATSPDYETTASYTVTVTAKDPSDAGDDQPTEDQSRDTITVRIMVTDVDEDPVMANPTALAGHTAKNHDENQVISTVVSTYSATDEDDDNPGRKT